MRVTWLQTILLSERAVTLFLFALYLITPVQTCRFSSWQRAGAPNPFLPRRLEAALIPLRQHP